MCTTDSKHSLPVAANLLDRNFAADRPNQSLPRRRPGSGWPILPTSRPAKAIQRRRPGPGLIHHFERGSQYAAGDYRDILRAAAIVPSMSRKGNCCDNAPMQGFCGTLKTELVHHREYPDRDAARRDLFAYLEGYYNRQRIHSAIGYITPQQAEAKSA